MACERQLTELPPLSLYIHIPWCVRKCPYCDFNSHQSNNIPETEYIAALINDLEQELVYVQGRRLHSIFFGGGTPSLFSAHSISTILTEVEKRIAFSPTIEITLEANPGTMEQGKFAGYRSAGVNRLSIGVQSFNSTHLTALGRIHSNQDAVNAANEARQAGFSNFNLDLMHGLPNQTLQQAKQDLRQAMDLGPKHISWYQLTIEPNTTFYNKPPTLPIDEQLADIQDYGEKLLSDNGYQQYEISAYSQQGEQSQHNLNYWQFGDYIGIGAGAHGKLTVLAEQHIIRRWKTRAPKDYLADKDFLAGCRTLSNEDLPLEFFMNVLRLNQGFSPALFAARTGLEFEQIKPRIENLFKNGLLRNDGLSIRTTERGKRFLNDVLAELDH